MPIRLRDSAKFKWLESDLPLAPVVSIGAAQYILACPGCGCLHELSGTFTSTGQTRIVTKPRCLLAEFANAGGRGGADWKTIYQNWLKAYPGAAAVSEVRAVYLGSISEIVTVAAAVKAMAAYAQPVEQEAIAA